MNHNPNQKPNANKKKFSVTDIVLIALGLFVLIRTPWSDMNSFHYLLFFLYIFCIMMRITNIRKQHSKKGNQQKNVPPLQSPEMKEDVPFSEKTDGVQKASVPQEVAKSEKDTPSE